MSQKPIRAQWLKKCSRTTQYLLFYYSVLLRRLRGLKKQLRNTAKFHLILQK
jgi:hypothetical protein